MMSRMWMVVLSAALLLLGPSACTVIDGQCWSRSEDDSGSGAGGGPIVPGQGGYGDVAPKPQGAGDSPPPADCASIGQFSPTLFKFTTTLADDGKGEAGGWQEATATLGFVDDRHIPSDAFTCTLHVGMAVRSSLLGVISASRAADMTATVLTYSASPVMRSRPKWIQALYCSQLKDEMNKMFADGYRGAGARVELK